ncbi:hypothetical protein [Cellulosimicrobium sp. Marseille-Q4280]|uniref:hypothetical protein n=1 Tax=Cellulosimicrobium sp. Marseille-Q4280 TaxID=2937992 RepID=UPI0020410E3C|nr:hypothetical protein [Cellulosimicrobium sp. Marseille-Q4280]
MPRDKKPTSKKQQDTQDVWSSAPEVPRSGLPDEAARNKGHRRIKRYITFAAFALPVLIVLAGLSIMSTVASEDPPPAVVETAPPTQPLAMAAVENWLASTPKPLPGASLLTWEDYEVLPWVAEPNATNQDRTERQSHTLLVRAATGNLMRVQVLIALSPEGGQAVVGTPSLAPTAGEDVNLASTPTWSGLTTDSPSSDVVQAVTTWVGAYTSGDPVALRQVVGDPDASHTYLPLSGLTGARGTVLSGGWITEGTGDEAVRTGDMVVSLTMTLPWNGQDPDATNQTVATYDLLVSGADTAAPRVVAWGGAGTGPTLSAYDNAIVGQVTDQPLPVETGAPEPATDAPATENQEG